MEMEPKYKLSCFRPKPYACIGADQPDSGWYTQPEIKMGPNIGPISDYSVLGPANIFDPSALASTYRKRTWKLWPCKMWWLYIDGNDRFKEM